MVSSIVVSCQHVDSIREVTAVLLLAFQTAGCGGSIAATSKGGRERRHGPTLSRTLVLLRLSGLP